ncbi:MAG TPA: ABC transporter ATP-binding protein [Terriglobales bacterium]|nr:ABC transporter ATP-binding protein [Terriglobales bacterium]
MNYYEEEAHVRKIDARMWKRMLSLLGPFKRHLIWVIVITLISGGVDVVIPLFQTYAIDHFIIPGTLDGIWPFFAVGSSVVLFQVVVVVIYCRIAFKVEIGFGRELKRSTFEQLQKLSFSYYNKTPVGYMLARVLSDADKLSMMMAWGLLDFLWSAVYVAGVLVSMVILSPRLALPIIAIVPCVALLTWWFQSRILDTNRQVRRGASRIAGSFNEGITGARTSKTLVMEAFNDEGFAAQTASLYRDSVKNFHYTSLFTPIVMFFGSMATAVVLWRGGELVRSQLMAFGVLSVFITYSVSIFEPVQQLAKLFADFIGMQANIERVAGLLDARPDVEDSPEVVARYGDCFNPKTENFEPIRGDIAFEHVFFRYGEAEREVIEDFSLTVPAGSMVALVGETGAGKSTLVNLLCRFFEPTGGRILIDGRDYRERSQLWLHRNLGYVLQSPHLFSGSIADNIRYGKLDATDDELKEAARLACADHVALRRAEGYDFDVGEGGDRLSTGEKQLISFARAIVAHPAIFVLDEATSSVDTETEQLIQSAIARVLKGRTSFIIAHRLSTIRMADLILVIEDGKVAEQGTHGELIRKKGAYYSMYTRQYAAQAVEEVLHEGRTRPGLV